MSEPQDPTPARVRLTHTGPLDATTLLELYVPLPGSPPVTIVHDGPVTDAARKWARRLEIQLDEAPAPGPAPAPGTADDAADDDGDHDAPLVIQLQPDGPPARAPPAEPAMLPAPEAIPMLPEHVALEAPAALEAPPVPTVPTVPTVLSVPNAPVERPEQAEPPVPVTEPALPWDARVPVADPPAAHVAIGELLAFPWNTLDSIAERAAEEDDHHEVMDGSPRRPTEHHPSMLLPQAPNWGLPWPRPVAPAGAVAKVDPTLWHEPERLAAMREDLEKVGAPSFGAVKPAEGASGWLKKLADSG